MCSLVCKKDHTRTDYRKAEKMRPGIWYLILAVGYLLISIWSLYFVCTMFVAVTKTICASATFVDVISDGKETDPTWVGVQRLGKQIYIFSQEATISKANYLTFFDKYSSTVDSLQGLNDEIYE